MTLAALKVGQEIEYQYTTGRNRWTKHSGRIQHITDTLIAIQTARYPDCLALADLVAGHAVITSPAMDFSGVRMRNRQEPVLVGKWEPYITWKERKAQEGAESMSMAANISFETFEPKHREKIDWAVSGPKALAMKAEGKTTADIANDLGINYQATWAWLKKNAPADLLPTPMSAPPDSPHPADILPGGGLLPNATTLVAVDGDYQRRIFERFHAQRAKGIGKYGQPLEDNPASREERLEHLAQELTDGLMYIEWIKAYQEYGFREYAIAAWRTVQKDTDDRELLLNGVFGLIGEAGEVVDHLKKHLFQGHELDSTKVADELGDVLWYVNLIAAASGCELDSIARGNIDKLLKRYPGEGFDAACSITREV